MIALRTEMFELNMAQNNLQPTIGVVKCDVDTFRILPNVNAGASGLNLGFQMLTQLNRLFRRLASHLSVDNAPMRTSKTN